MEEMYILATREPTIFCQHTRAHRRATTALAFSLEFQRFHGEGQVRSPRALAP